VIGTAAKDTPSQKFLPAQTIHVETLGGIFANAKDLKTATLKVDAQGFECSAVDGGKNTFSKVQCVKAEAVDQWLKPQNFSVGSPIQRLEDLGCDLNAEGGGELTGQRTPKWTMPQAKNILSK
jgi:hypothetical protein